MNEVSAAPHTAKSKFTSKVKVIFLFFLGQIFEVRGRDEKIGSTFLIYLTYVNTGGSVSIVI